MWTIIVIVGFWWTLIAWLGFWKTVAIGVAFWAFGRVQQHLHERDM